MALHEHDRILVCLRWGIGDLILQWPVLETLRRAAPRAHLTFLGARPAIQLLEGAGLADSVRAYQEFGMTHIGDTDRAASTRFESWLRSASFDAVADMLAAPPAARRVGWRAGTAHYESDRPATRAALMAGADAAGAQAAGAARGWGLPGIRPVPRLDVSEREAAADAVLDERGVPRHDWVGLVPFASHALKRWPPERFAAVARRLAERGQHVLVFAAPDDDSAEQVVSAGGDAVALVPPLHLRTTGALMARAAVAVGNDTGLLHLAAAVETPAVALFGPTDPGVYAPAGCREIAARARRPCQHRQDRSLLPPGCWTSEHCLIGERSCIEEVTVEAVLHRVETARSAAALATSQPDARG